MEGGGEREGIFMEWRGLELIGGSHLPSRKELSIEFSAPIHTPTCTLNHSLPYHRPTSTLRSSLTTGTRKL